MAGTRQEPFELCGTPEVGFGASKITFAAIVPEHITADCPGDVQREKHLLTRSGDDVRSLTRKVDPLVLSRAAFREKSRD